MKYRFYIIEKIKIANELHIQIYIHLFTFIIANINMFRYLFFILIFTFIVIFISYKPLLTRSKRYFTLLFIFRFFSISIILFLLLNVSIFRTKILVKTPLTKVYFDRGSYKYHGRVKLLADELRKNGMEF